MSPPPGWLTPLNELWQSNAVAATLAARGQWEAISAAVLAQSGEWARAEREASEARHPPAIVAGPDAEREFSDAVTQHAAAGFDAMLRLVAASHGDPPVPRELLDAAAAVLAYEPAGERVSALSDEVIGQLAPWVPPLVAAAAAAGLDAGAMRSGLTRLAAALALPRIELLRSFGQAPPAGDPAADELVAALDEGLKLRQTDPARAEERLVRALELAATSAPPAVNVMLLQSLLNVDRTPVPDTMRACVARLAALVEGGTGGDVVAGLIVVAAARSVGAGLSDVLLVLARAGSALARTELSPDVRTTLTLEAAELWMRQGRLDLADEVVHTVRSHTAAPGDRLRLAEFEAKARASAKDRAGATSVLLEALREPHEAPSAARRDAVLTLLAGWPVSGTVPDGEPVDRWIDEAGRLLADTEEPARTLGRAVLMSALYRLGRVDEASAQRRSIDFAELRASSPDYESWSETIEPWTDEQERTAATPGSDAIEDYPKAAREALSAAETCLARGFRVQAFDNLGAAGTYYHLGGDARAALEVLERAFALFEQDVIYLPYADLVVSRLAWWSDLYARAAVATLDVGDPMRAVGLAEVGRGRATGARIGRSRSDRPPAAPPEHWDRYVQLWRRAVAGAANQLVGAGGWTGRAVAPDVARELDDLRRQFLAAGVRSEDLAPLAPLVDPAVVLDRLRVAPTPTVVVYTVRLHGTLRFVRIGADGASEIPLGPEDQRAVLAAVDDHVRRLRSARDVFAELPGAVGDLLATVGPRLRGVAEVAVAGLDHPRLLWVPQGTLVAVPIQAVECGGGVLGDTASVIVATSLSSGLSALDDDVCAPMGPAVVRGPSRGVQASTEGGSAIVSVASVDAVDETLPTTVDQLEAACQGRSLTYLVCHGFYDWDDPLASHLQLGFDLPIADLFDGLRLDPGSLVLLGACDAATMAQRDLNEAIGFPAGLAAAGAGTVVGAAWPVAQPVALGVCLKFMQLVTAGTPSPEALQAANLWIRDASYESLRRELAAVGHPFAEALGKLPESARARRPFREAWLWASYVHWGGGWRTAAAPHDRLSTSSQSDRPMGR